MNNLNKTVRLGTIQINRGRGERAYSIYCSIKYDGKRLSIAGVEGPFSSGDCAGSCGQIVMHLNPDEINPAPNWDKDKIAQFLAYWDKWHLNDMRAGTPAQMAELEKHEFPGYPVSYYDWASEILNNAGLNPDNGYKYGSAWLTESVPDDVIKFLQSLPETDKTPAWV